ncbi:PerC family transcriptional regulator [Citrobacter koseri]|uniref:PerC family transcriptional regulator n=1 Tax=Citrobacter koseri TaxID=545 RepID=UPI0023AAE9EB|nr:PerC family transcriptional regulator [Citrobacter koseri]WEE19120.1 PerC family transcriptional regulator [Citrobacter koseri]
MTKELSQKDQVAVVVRHIPGCVLRDVCEALDIAAGTAGRFLRALTVSGTITRSHNGTQYVYDVEPGAVIPDVTLPFMEEKSDPVKTQAVESIARNLESRGLWRRAATVYTDMLAIASNSVEVARIAQRREECLRMARR